MSSTRRTSSGGVNLAVNQTLVRSINTTVVALLPVASILFIGALLLGAGTLRDISLALFIGMLAGTYSSIFIAPPLLVLLRRRAAVLEQDPRVVEAHTAARPAPERAPTSPPAPAAQRPRPPSSADRPRNQPSAGWRQRPAAGSAEP